MIRLVPATPAVARAVVHGAGALPEQRAADWPHAGTADALRGLADHPELVGPGTFLVTLDGAVVGECGWFGPPVDGEARIGYGLAPSARGRGTGTEAARLLLAWVAARGATRVRAEVRPGNEPSFRLLARLGFTVDGEDGSLVHLTRSLGGIR